MVEETKKVIRRGFGFNHRFRGRSASQVEFDQMLEAADKSDSRLEDHPCFGGEQCPILI